MTKLRKLTLFDEEIYLLYRGLDLVIDEESERMTDGRDNSHEQGVIEEVSALKARIRDAKRRT